MRPLTPERHTVRPVDIAGLVREIESSGATSLEPGVLLDLVTLLDREGATGNEIRAAAASGTLGGLALELALRSGPETFAFPEAAARAGLTEGDAMRIWTALGFPDARRTGKRLDQAGVDALAFLTGMGNDFIGPEHTLALSRTIGAATARLAEAVVDAFRIRLEMPQLNAGVPYSDVVENYVVIAREQVPRLTATLASVLQQHLVEVASGAWTFDQEGGTARRQLCVGFVDMVGYTAFSRTASTQTLVHTITRFDTLVTAALGRGGGRLVKLIGDGAMFVVDEPEVACRLALDLDATFESDGSMPPIRIGVAYGTVVASNDDYYGNAVNLAARLMATADPGSVVATAEVAGRAGPGGVAEPLPAQVLKGYPEPVTAFRISASRR